LGVFVEDYYAVGFEKTNADKNKFFEIFLWNFSQAKLKKKVQTFFKKNNFFFFTYSCQLLV
jgi:hypothetical protein